MRSVFLALSTEFLKWRVDVWSGPTKAATQLRASRLQLANALGSKPLSRTYHPASISLSMRPSTPIALPLNRSIPPDASDAPASPSNSSETVILWSRLQNGDTEESNSKYVRKMPPPLSLLSILGTQRMYKLSVPNLVIKGWVIVPPKFLRFAADPARRLFGFQDAGGFAHAVTHFPKKVSTFRAKIVRGCRRTI